MRLKKLTIIGFKSFAEKVVLDFDCEIIGIVGPNGCGKSNIVDAFRWVMGEQSAKSLRGDKMHDVLFAGSDKRKPLNYAEVSVSLTDIDGELPLPYEELTITRRLHRSGESEYFINRELVRLKDIHTLFLGSGIGKNAFSIFEQGKLDQVIHLSPVERRVIFDEAAGTSRFLQRKKETVRKLALVSENYARLHDVHAEIEKQTKQLKKQAHSAKHFQENKTRLEELEKGVLIFRFRALASKNAVLEEKLQLLNASTQEAQGTIAALEERLQQTKEQLLQEELGSKQQLKELHACETKQRLLEAETAQNKHRLFELKKREEGVKTHLQELTKGQEEVRLEIVKKEKLLQTSLQKKERLETVFQQKTEAHLAVEQEVVQLRDEVKKQQQLHLQKVQEEGKLAASVQEKKIRHEAATARFFVLENLEKKEHKNLALLKEEGESQKLKVASLTQLIDTFKGEFESVEKELTLLRGRLSEAHKQEMELTRQITEKESHQKALMRLKEEMEGFSAGAKALLKEAQNNKSPLYRKVRPLYDYLIADKGYEELLASTMRAYAETLVVDSEADFSELLAFAKKKKISDFSALIKSRIPEAQKTSKKNTMTPYVAKNPIVYHFTQQFELVEEGHFYDALGVFFHAESGKKLNNALFRQAELSGLAESLTLLQNALKKQGETLSHLAEKLKLEEKRRSEIVEVRRKKEMDLIQENFMLQRALSDAEKVQKELFALSKEKESLKNLANEEKEIGGLKEEQNRLQEKIKFLFETLQGQELLLEKQQKDLSKSAQVKQEAHTQFLEAKNEANAIYQEIQICQAREKQSALHEKKMVQEIEEIRLQVETTIQTIAKQEKESEMAASSLKKEMHSTKEKEKILSEVKKECDSYDKELSLKRKTLASLDKERHGVEVSLAQDLSERKTIEHELLEKHSLLLSGIASQEGIPEEGVAEAMNEMQRLRSSLESAGAVNLAAIEEFEETQERFDFLDKQLKDVEASKKDLEEIITKLDQESRKIFKKTFQEIRENFQKNFAILFHGGSADLTFTESSDILEAGIEIVAKPPGKQMRSISLLSGGEKCLTALALLFSIFEVRPAPFCILDEVDAPLDDSNIDRFTAVLKQFIDKTQFIIVTHNKKTMAIADLLIGVSMEEKGVSKLISLAFEKTVHLESSNHDYRHSKRDQKP